MNLWQFSVIGLWLGVVMVQPAIGTAAGAAAMARSPMSSVQIAGLFHTLDVLEDVDDVLDGDFADIDPVREFTEDVEDALDDVNDTIDDVTHINIYEPFTDIDDEVEDFVDDVDDTMNHIANDIEDWFD